jgi:hypothetical protein
VEPGSGFVTRLREAIRDAPAAERIVIQTSDHPPHQREAANDPPPLGEGRVGVVTHAMSDTVKEVVDGKVRRTVARETLVHVVGPWIFDREALVDALTRLAGGEGELTDMIGLSQAARLRVRALQAR